MSEKEFKEFSPIYYASPDDPPALIVHGDQDIFVPFIEGESMYKALNKEGVKSKLFKIPGEGHELKKMNMNWKNPKQFEQPLLKK